VPKCEPDQVQGQSELLLQTSPSSHSALSFDFLEMKIFTYQGPKHTKRLLLKKERTPVLGHYLYRKVSPISQSNVRWLTVEQGQLFSQLWFVIE